MSALVDGGDPIVVVEDDDGSRSSRSGSARARNVYEITAKMAALALHADADAAPGVYTPGQLLWFEDFDPDASP